MRYKGSPMKIVELPLDSLELRYAGLRARRPAAEKRLLASLGDTGQQSPVIVVKCEEPGRYVVIDGHKRVEGLRKLRSDVVKAVLWELPCERALVTAYQMGRGSGWNALEEGWLVAELVRVGGWSLKAAGAAMDRSEGWASRRLGLVESLPETVLDGVQKGRIGAYAAMKYLLPLARAKAQDCERLAAKIAEAGLSSREVEALCRYYAGAGREGKRRMLNDPRRFLKVLEAAKHKEVGLLEPEQGRCVKNLELVGGVSLGLARALPKAAGYDAPDGVRERIHSAWAAARERFGLLEKTAAAVFEAPGTQAKPPEAAQEKRVHAG